MMKKLNKILMVLVFLFAVTFTVNVYAASESEPNDDFDEAMKVKVGVQYKATAKGEGYSSDEDYYKIKLTKGKIYKITISDLKVIKEGYSNTDSMYVKYFKDENDGLGSYIFSETSSKYKKTKALIRANRTGYHYIYFTARRTSYSFKIEEYNIKGKKVTDDDNNTYKFTKSDEVELTNVGNKKSKNFYFHDQYFSKISGMKLLDYANNKFYVTSIGDYAFKGCNIEYITINSYVKNIGKGAFENCKSLGKGIYATVIIEGTNVKIGKDAFKGCKSLKSLAVSKDGSIKSIAKGAFKGTAKGINLKVPNVKKYKTIFKNSGVSKPKYSKSTYSNY